MRDGLANSGTPTHALRQTGHASQSWPAQGGPVPCYWRITYDCILLIGIVQLVHILASLFSFTTWTWITKPLCHTAQLGIRLASHGYPFMSMLLPTCCLLQCMRTRRQQIVMLAVPVLGQLLPVAHEIYPWPRAWACWMVFSIVSADVGCRCWAPATNVAWCWQGPQCSGGKVLILFARIQPSVSWVVSNLDSSVVLNQQQLGTQCAWSH